MIGVASWSVFLRDRPMLETVASYFREGRGNGRLEHYIYPSGQAQESGRDQVHTQDGLEHLLEVCPLPPFSLSLSVFSSPPPLFLN